MERKEIIVWSLWAFGFGFSFIISLGYYRFLGYLPWAYYLITEFVLNNGE